MVEILFALRHLDVGKCRGGKKAVVDFFFRRERLEENEQQNLAIMLMVVVLIFVLCNVLAMVANILDLLNFNAGALTKVCRRLKKASVNASSFST